MQLDLTQTRNVIKVDMWPDNRHLGAYITDSHTKTVRGEWLNSGRVLRLNTDLTLATQQGETPVNILSQYKLSTNGELLTLVELRNTRNRPVFYVFKRVSNTR